MAEALDLSPAIRTALVQAAGIGDELGFYHDEPAVFTRRPVPDDASAFPQVIVEPPYAIGDEDGLTSDRPVVMRDVKIYGLKGRPASDGGEAGVTDDQTRLVERIAYRTRALFHRERFSIVPDGYFVVDIRAGGPVPAPVDDDATVGRLVSLTIRLRRKT